MSGLSEQEVAWVDEQLDVLQKMFKENTVVTGDQGRHMFIMPLEFIRTKVGPQSEIYRQAAEAVNKRHPTTARNIVMGALLALLEMTEEGLISLPVEAEARVYAANDLMEQVETLLQDRRVHPAAPVMLAGAALEEFLRSLVVTHDAKPKGKPGISSYATALRTAEVLEAQDIKDVTAWAGMRNAAAHGQFDQIEIPNARLMAQGINLFMRQHAVVMPAPNEHDRTPRDTGVTQEPEKQ